MPQVLCNHCSLEFYAKPSWIKNGYGKYCSRKCSQDSQRNGKIFKCVICSTSVYRNLKDQKRSKSGKFFCSKSCQTIWRNSMVYTGNNHPNWVNGESSYRNKMIRGDADKVCKRCLENDSRILAVHHKDKNRKNNELCNLIWLCHNCHFLVHNFKNESQGFIVLTN
jgi:hypothetical protein